MAFIKLFAFVLHNKFPPWMFRFKGFKIAVILERNKSGPTILSPKGNIGGRLTR